MLSNAKNIQLCDNCRSTLDKKDDSYADTIKATLTNTKGENQEYHLCDEDCLLDLLKKRAIRAKTKKKSKASLSSNFYLDKYFIPVE